MNSVRQVNQHVEVAFYKMLKIIVDLFSLTRSAKLMNASLTRQLAERMIGVTLTSENNGYNTDIGKKSSA